MAKFEVRVMVSMPRYFTVEVDAADRDAAMTAAEQIVDDHTNKFGHVDPECTQIVSESDGDLTDAEALDAEAVDE